MALNRPSLRILLGLVAGLVGGGLLAGSAFGTFVSRGARPIGRLWLDGLTMTVVPLVFSLLVTGVVSAAEQASSGRVAVRSLLWIAAMLIAACFLALGVTSLILEIWPVPAAASTLTVVGEQVPPVPVDWIVNIVPTNPIKAAAETAM